MAYNINHANIKDWAANYDGELFDGILCDPPYELGFMGKSWDSSGSEMIGALQAGWEYVEGVELTEEYIPIAEARIKHWLDKMSKEQLEML